MQKRKRHTNEFQFQAVFLLESGEHTVRNTQSQS